MANIKDNPQRVTFTEAVRADRRTDITPEEMEILTNGSDADALHIHNILRSGHTTVTTTTHTAADDSVILVDDDTAGAGVTVTLPAAADSSGLIYHVKKLGTTGTVTVDGAGAETIDGAATAALTTQFESIQIISDGTEWWTL